MLVELGLVEQRYRAVSEVLVEGVTVSEVATRFGVSRQSVHAWLRRYAEDGMPGLVDRSCRPDRCPHQTPAELEVAVMAMAGSIRPGGRGGSWWSWTGPVWPACRADRRSIGSWSATISSTRSAGDGGGRTIAVGSDPGRWSCGRWTSWTGSVWPTGGSCRKDRRVAGLSFHTDSLRRITRAAPNQSSGWKVTATLVREP